MTTLQRKFTDLQIEKVRQHPLFQCCQAGIAAGDILPCLRKEEIHLYERGARLLRFSKQGVFTHAQYTGQPGTRDVRLCDSGTGEFVSIRETARTHRKELPTSELAAVHTLFPDFAVTRSAHRDGELALIDVEIRFGEDENDAALKKTMIDLAFILPSRKILFVEAKCIGNAAISSMNEAPVEKQVASYEKQIQVSGVLEAINQSLLAQSKLVERDLGQAEGICSMVPVLILNPAGNRSLVSKKNHWLRRALAKAPCWSPSSGGVGIIDGTSCPITAIRQFAARCDSL